MVNEGVRGGACFGSKKICEANHPSMPDDYDPTKPNRILLICDLNSLYGTALATGKYPVDKYEWVTKEELKAIDWTDPNLGNDGWGYILRVNLRYTPEKHDYTVQYPLCAQKKKVSYDQISPYQRVGN